jgi:hypothetical protein
MIEKNGEGIIGMITAHGYIDNPTFRGMRWHLRKTFDKIYIVDLHGNSRKKEVALDGSVDQNVFDIMTGVSIFIGVKKASTSPSPYKGGEKLADVFVYDIFGKREEKYLTLSKLDLEKMKWTKLSGDFDLWKVEGAGKDEYMKGFSVAEIFLKNTTGIVTMGDGFIIDQDKNVLEKRIGEFLNNNISESELKSKYNLGKNYAK